MSERIHNKLSVLFILGNETWREKENFYFLLYILQNVCFFLLNNNQVIYITNALKYVCEQTV